MALTSTLKNVVDLPVWEWVRFAPVATAANSTAVSDWNSYYLGGTPRFAYYANVAALYRYDTVADSWQQLANDPNPPTLATSMTYSPVHGYFGKAIGPGPGLNTIQIAALNGNSLVGNKIWIYAGSGAGQEKTIISVSDPTIHDSGLITGTSAALTANAYIEDTSTLYGVKTWKWNQWRDYQFRITFGPGASAGPNQIRRVLYNTASRMYFADNNYSLLHGQFSPVLSTAPTAAASYYQIESSVVTVDSPWTTPPDSTSKFVVKTGGIWRVSGTANAPFYVLSYYDIAADVWYIKSTLTGLWTAAWTSLDVAIEATGECCGGINTDGTVASPLTSNIGTVSTAAAPYDLRTLTDSGQNMQVNKYANMIVRITGGKGRGQRRLILGNTLTSFTISRDWDVVPDSTSTYQVIGDSNKLYLVGGGSAEIVAHDIIEDMPAIGRQIDFGATRTFYAEYAPEGVGVVAVDSGGTGYAVGDILTLTDNTYYAGTGATVKVLTAPGGVVGTVSLVTAGTGYIAHATSYATTGGGGTGATITVSANAIPSQPPLGVSSIARNTGSLFSVSVAVAGSGYNPNDLLTLNTGTGGIVRVLTVTSTGGVSTISIEQPGLSYAVNTTYATTNTSVRNSTATGCTISTAATFGVCDTAIATTGLNHNFTIGDTVFIGGCNALSSNLSQSYYGGARTVCGTNNAAGAPTATCFNFYLPTGGVASITNTAGAIASVSSITTAGVGYRTGTGLLPTVATYGLTVASGGTGYAVGDLLLVAGGTGGIVKVATLSGTAVATVTLMNPGTGYSVANPVATTNLGNYVVTGTGGGGSFGSGCTLNVTAVGSPYSVTGGSNGVLNVTAVNGTGGITSAAVIAGAAGTGYTTTATFTPTGSAALFNAETTTNNLTIIDNTKNWRPNEHVGKILITCLGGPAATAQSRRIVANTSHSLTVGVAITAPGVGLTQYLIHDPKPFGTEHTNKGDLQKLSAGMASGGTTTTLVDNHTGLLTVAVASGGTTNAVGDVLTLATGTGGKVTVSAVSSGVVTAVTVTNPGTGYAADTTYATTSSGGGSGCTITVTKLNGKNWNINQWAGMKVKILAGAGVDSNPNELLIASNTATTLTLATNWSFSAAPDTTTVYAIMDNWGVVSGAAAGGLTLTTTNGVVTGVPANASVNTAGTGYVVGDVLWVNGGTAIGVFIKVLTLSGSGVATFTVLNPGSGLVVSTTYSSVCLTGAGSGFVLAAGAAVSTVGAATTINDPFQKWGTSNLQTKRFHVVAGSVTAPGTEVAISTSTASQFTVATTTTVTDANQQYAIYGTLARPTAASVGVSSFMRIFGSTTWEKGRFFLAWRGCGTSLVERYDLTQMIWEFVTVGDSVSEVHTIGSMFEYNGKDRVYFTKGGDTTGRVMYYDIPTNNVVTCSSVPFGMGTAVQGNRIFTMSTTDLAGANMEYVYIMRHSGQEAWRTLVFW